MFPLMLSVLRRCIGLLACCLLVVCASARADDTDEVTRLFRIGQTEQAFARLDRLLAAQPKDVKLRFLKGVLQSDAKRTDEAIATFRQLTQDHPDLPEPYNNLAVIHAARGDYAQARSALEAALTANPAYAVAQQNLGDVLLQLARQSFAAAAKLDPGNAGVAARLALLHQLDVSIAKPPAAP